MLYLESLFSHRSNCIKKYTIIIVIFKPTIKCYSFEYKSTQQILINVWLFAEAFFNLRIFGRPFVAYNIVKHYYTYVWLQKFKNFSLQNF